MAGIGKRMRPHTITVPKPLLPIAGKPIVERIVEEIKYSYTGEIDEIVFIIGDFGTKVEKQLIKIAEKNNANGKIYYQKEALGTGHAIYCAKESLYGPCIIVFADTLFKGTFNIGSEESIIWTYKVGNASQYGVVKYNSKKNITEFVEKPKDYVSNQAIIGIYYFKNIELLTNDLTRLIDNKIMVNGEYQLTDSLEELIKNGVTFIMGEVEEWLDCGNKNEFLKTNKKIIELESNNKNFLGKNVSIKNSKIKKYVSIGDNCVIRNSVVENSLIYENTRIEDSKIYDSMIGNNCIVKGINGVLNLGDFSTVEKD